MDMTTTISSSNSPLDKGASLLENGPVSMMPLRPAYLVRAANPDPSEAFLCHETLQF